MPSGEKRHKIFLCFACALFVGLLVAVALLGRFDENRLKVQRQVKAYSQTHDRDARKNVQDALQEMGAEAIPYLVELIGYRESRWDRWRYALNQKAPASIQQEMESPEVLAGLRSHAARLLLALPDKERAVPSLVKLLDDDSAQVRVFAMQPLSRLIQGTEQKWLPVFLECLQDPADQRNGMTPVIVAKFCDGSPEARKGLELLLEHPEEKLRLQVASLLWTSERENLPARKVVEQSLESADLLQRLFAARIYYSRTKDASMVIPLYSKALASPNWLDQSVALSSLKEMGTEAEPVAEEVEPFLSASNQVLSNSAWQVLEAVREK